MPSLTIVCGLCIRNGVRPDPIEAGARRKHLTTAHRYSENDTSLGVLERLVFVYLGPDGSPADMAGVSFLRWAWEQGDEKVRSLVGEYLSPDSQRTELSRTISHLEAEREKCADEGARSVLTYLIRRAKAERAALDDE